MSTYRKAGLSLIYSCKQEATQDGVWRESSQRFRSRPFV